MAVTGDVILQRPIAQVTEPRFLELISLLRGADVSIGNFEGVIHDYDGPEVYPAAEAGYTWMRAPRSVTDDLRWIGFDAMSLANNHSLDYSYGGLLETRAAFESAGIGYAGTGRNLGEAQLPAFIETATQRVALLSMTSSFAKWGRAGQSRGDVKGRPGVNPLGFHFALDPERLATYLDLAKRLGVWINQISDTEYLLNPPGMHNTLTRVVESSDGPSLVVDEADQRRILATIGDARRRADLVVVQVHNHEWDAELGLTSPPQFIRSFAQAAVTAGADVVLVQGSHALRGLELFASKVIFYDPGDFLGTPQLSRLPHDFYERHRQTLPMDPHNALLSDALVARSDPIFAEPLNPVGGYGYGHAGIRGGILPLLEFDVDGSLSAVTLHPFGIEYAPRVHHALSGIPIRAGGDDARAIVDFVSAASETFGTKVILDGQIGRVEMG
jgi:poly-gamma-glutamate synthesis protein (capsule biosynthesis protein)